MLDETIVAHQRGIQVQGDYVRFLRMQRGWTQQVLAERAGYCDRLIRKAESNGYLMAETINVLAEALSTPERKIDASDLWYSPRKTIERFLALLYGNESIVNNSIAAIASESIEVWCKGTALVPFSGRYHGRRAFMHWMQLFRRYVNCDAMQRCEHTILVENHQAFAHTCVVFEFADMRSDSLDLDIRFDLSAMASIAKVVLSADTLDVTQFFVQGLSKPHEGPRIHKAK